MTRWVVILAGGVGSRFWPLSTPTRPKQLLPLIDAQPLLRNTVDRLLPLADPDRILILTNASLVEPIHALLPEIPRENLIAEPKPAGTAAALAWAASVIAKRDGDEAVMLSVHADWAIGDAPGFRAALERAATVAEAQHALVTVGVVPSRPDPGFGYIRPGEALDGGGQRVAQFVEKPTRERAAEMVRDGYLWNSGIFVWRVGDFLGEVRAHTPEVAPALADAHGEITRFFATVKSISVDVGVLERTDNVVVIPGSFGWDDVGTWAALARVRTHDAAGNAANGPVHLVDARDNVVQAEGNDVVLYGVQDLVVVVRDGLTLVTTTERAADLKTLLDALPSQVRDRP
ncbi:MAG: mannose-1-phosphate guanylyltransferase [Gemmatimonadetes bacterium]|nr:mannose-1-phosphate guanylyltransferase [Gemmatimonadota bacterium]MBK8062240.1 mannose-1-phosphate guanylyltransferase [Gemmatimonadota bacterium]MBK8645890.1 mannose-1-phosphate guanylyltransferase [Gemmatimonadota bacterium]MBK9407973.1 mannose-1-phosphate guanylyltransferase [Gemmatimonadota bacterium]MBK9979005.1 mannose-1-phosphate guanylyltransferase [Gemmatimonadota bacterium]